MSDTFLEIREPPLRADRGRRRRAVARDGQRKAAGLPQAAVSYQPTPKDGHQCSDCKLFVEPNACKSVSGEIAPRGMVQDLVEEGVSRS